MANFPSFTPLKKQKEVHEQSQQMSARESDSPWKLWKAYNSVRDQVNSLTELVKVLYRKVQPIVDARFKIHLHPFKVYQYPDVLRMDSLDPSDDTAWRRVVVRSGAVLTNNISGSNVNVIGTDNIIDVTDTGYIPQLTGSMEIIVPASSSMYWMWIEVSDDDPPLYNLRHGSNPSIASAFNPNPWDTWPDADNQHFVVAYVDTVSSASVHQPIIRQYLRSDIISAGGGVTPGMKWKGDYNFNNAYFKNDVIRTRHDVQYHAETTQSLEFGQTSDDSFSLTPIGLGLFICTRDIPSGSMVGSNSMGSASATASADSFRWYAYNDYYPFWPEIPPTYSFSQSVFGGSGSVLANATFWQAMPMSATTQYVCLNNSNMNKKHYVWMVQSGSEYLTQYLPVS